VRRVARTANPESRPVASEISGRGPAVPVFAKEGPRSVEHRFGVSSKLHFDISVDFTCVLLALQSVIVEQRDAYLHQPKRPLRSKTARLRTGRAVWHTLQAWPDATSCDGQCQGPQDAPVRDRERLACVKACPSSDDLRQRPDLGKGGSGLRMEAMRPGRDAASGDWRWSGV
jgi:hypothetical protein